MNVFRVISLRLFALFVAANFLVSTIGVPLVYCFCGTEVKGVALATTSSLDECLMADHSISETSSDANAATATAVAVAEESCCDASMTEECSAAEEIVAEEQENSTDEYCAEMQASDVPSGCHREIHLEQLDTDAITSANPFSSFDYNFFTTLPLSIFQTDAPSASHIHAGFASDTSPPHTLDRTIRFRSLLI